MTKTIYTPFKAQPFPEIYPRSLDARRAAALCDLPAATKVGL